VFLFVIIFVVERECTRPVVTLISSITPALFVSIIATVFFLSIEIFDFVLVI